MRKFIKLLIGLLLLPVCAGAAITLATVFRATSASDTVYVALGAGAACWLAIFCLLPKPMLVYVFGHELTHALWTWLFGGKVKKFKAASSGGHVVITKNNFLITLAPYFFPLYAMLVVLIFAVGNRIWDWSPHLVWFHLLLGAAYAFHITLTFHILGTEQSDITQEGYVFSTVIIFLGNILVLLAGIPLVTEKLSLLTVGEWWWQETVMLLQKMAALWTRTGS